MLAPFQLLAFWHRFTYVKIATIITIAFIYFNPPYALANTWGVYRGFNINPNITENDIKDIAANGANLIRLNFNRHPLMKKEPPYEFDEDAFSKLDRILIWSKKFGLKVVIDPHTTPGTDVSTTTKADDDLWSNSLFHDLLVKLWDRIAQQYSNKNDIIAGYDLLNEPSAKALPFPSGPGDYNALIRKLISTIRMHDKSTAIIIEPPVLKQGDRFIVNRIEGVKYLNLPQDNNLVVSPHMYLPLSFTHQGVGSRKAGIPYAGTVDGINLNKATLAAMLQPAVEFSKKNGIPIFIGEFSASRTAGIDGNLYLKDLLELFSEYNWSWAYHDFRGAPMWDPELPLGTIKKGQRSPNSPRMQLLRNAFH